MADTLPVFLNWSPHCGDPTLDSIVVVVFVVILVGFDKYHQKQIQIPLMVRRAGLSTTHLTLLFQESANPWYTLAPHYDTKQSVAIK